MLHLHLKEKKKWFKRSCFRTMFQKFNVKKKLCCVILAQIELIIPHVPKKVNVLVNLNNAVFFYLLCVPYHSTKLHKNG